MTLNEPQRVRTPDLDAVTAKERGGIENVKWATSVYMGSTNFAVGVGY